MPVVCHFAANSFLRSALKADILLAQLNDGSFGRYHFAQGYARHTIDDTAVFFLERTMARLKDACYLQFDIIHEETDMVNAAAMRDAGWRDTRKKRNQTRFFWRLKLNQNIPVFKPGIVFSAMKARRHAHNTEPEDIAIKRNTFIV
jgi:hypothetical protein